MSYQVLARKWRPHTFQTMVGQEHILRMLSNALDQKRLHHAYLLTGTRGVGKTTLGRILAKCLNCETGVTSTPCDQCATCKAIDSGKFLDLFEVDAASRTKVEDTREMLENVMYAPSQGRYKVYLIDEVHMLSNNSFNALLKTLEEPPEHVKFILATTDPKKIPVTILSRCLQFHLKRILPEQIATHLQHICQTENITHEQSALEKISQAADGSMRDALSLLDQAIAYGHGEVKHDDVYAMLGSMAQDDLLPLVSALAAQDGNLVFEHIQRLAEHAPDYQQVLETLISLFHQIAVAQCVPNATRNNEKISALAKSISAADIQLYYQIALLARRDLDLSPGPLQGFEMAMLRMLALKPVLQTNEVATTTAAPTAAPIAKTKAEKHPTPVAASSPPPIPASNDWRILLPKLELSGMAYALAANCTLEGINGNKVTLIVSTKHQAMLNPKLSERITEALTRHFKQPMQLEVKETTEELITPSTQLLSEQKEKLKSATEQVMQDPKVKQLIDMYDATVEVSLLS